MSTDLEKYIEACTYPGNLDPTAVGVVGVVVVGVAVVVEEQLWKDPDWMCPHCQFVNFAIRQKCRNCGYDSNAGEFPYYNPLPPYQGLEERNGRR